MAAYATVVRIIGWLCDIDMQAGDYRDRWGMGGTHGHHDLIELLRGEQYPADPLRYQQRHPPSRADLYRAALEW